MIQPIRQNAAPSLTPAVPTAATAVVVRVVRFRLREGSISPRAAILQLMRGGASRDVAAATVYGSPR